MSHSNAAAISSSRPAVFNLAFRPFFLRAGIVAAVFMALWMGVYVLGWIL